VNIFFQEIKIEMYKKTIPEINLYCNAYSENKIGKSAYGVILYHNEHNKEISEVYHNTTTNRIDLLGIISGLRHLKKKSKVFVYTNSMYIIDPFNKGWINNWVKNNWVSNKKSIANVDLWQQLLELTGSHEVTFSYCRDGDILKCLNIAKMALKNNDILIDDFFEKSDDKEHIESSKTLQEQVTLKIKKEGDLCRKCNTPVIKKIPTHKKIKKNQSYYFEYYMLCPNCKMMYMVEEAKKLI
jgi:ribonuclease HI